MGLNSSNSMRCLIIALLFIASFINYLDRATLSVALPVVGQEFSLTPQGKGFVLSAFFWSYAAMQIPVGHWVDRSNLRWLYAGFFALWSLACGLTGLARTVGMLIFLRVLLGIGESIYMPGGSRTVSILYDPSERGLPTGLFDSGTRVGTALGAPLIAWLITSYGWRKMFLLVGFLAGIWLIPWLIVCPRGFGKGENRAPSPTTPEHQRTLPFTLSRDLIGISAAFFCFGYYWYLLLTWLPDYLVFGRHLTILKAGAFVFVPYAVFAVCMPLGGWIADRFIHRGWDEARTRKGIVTLGYAFGLFLVPAMYAHNTSSVLAFVGGASLVGLSTANMLVIVQVCAPTHEVGVWTGVVNFAATLGGVVAPVTTGFLIARTGSYTPGFVLAVIFLLCSLLAYWLIVGKLRSSSQLRV